MASAKQQKKVPTTAVPTVPDMPDLDVNIDVEDDAEDDPQDENHLMNILQKLKTAKHTLDSTRQKKKAKQLIEQVSTRYNHDADEVVNKHNKRWAAKCGALTLKMKKLKASTDEKLKSWEGNMADCEKKISVHRVGVRGILQTLANLEKEVKDTKSTRDSAVKSEIARIRQQVGEKLKQLQGLLIKTHSQSVKDDRFTKIIKSFIASF